MTLTELKADIQAAIPSWFVTINEAEMLNVQADQLERYDAFAYLEEFNTSNVDLRMGRVVTSHNEVYFCKLLPYFEPDAETRQNMREQIIYPAVKAVEKMLRDKYGVTAFSHDELPRGFDAAEVLIHITFDIRENECD